MVILGYTIDLFWVGVIGSLAVEVVAFLAHHDDGPLPQKYRKISFYFARAALAFVGGFLVIAYSIEHPVAALQIGASASAILLSFSKKEPPPGPGDGGSN